MFTGIIRHVGTVREVQGRSGPKQLTIDMGPLGEGLAQGDSVAVNGACLTVGGPPGPDAVFDVTAETLQRTTLGSLRAGSKANLERAMKLSDSLDGHMVQGHVDGVVEVARIRRGGEHVIEFAAPAELTDQMVSKGSVAVDGVSLTLTSVGGGGFSVVLIPTTLSQTTLGDLAVGAKVNIETDVIGKYVRGYLEQLGGGGGRSLTLEKLKKAGFV
jgi:riboflavin synthase